MASLAVARTKEARAEADDQLRNTRQKSVGCARPDFQKPLQFARLRQARALRSASRMSGLAAIFVVVSSVGLSIGLSRLAVGEMFRIVRSDAQKRKPQQGPTV